jgi:SAM-dependent methyltransferase
LPSGEFRIQYSDYTEHYTLDAGDVPMPEDFGFFRRNQEKRRLETVSRMVPRTGVRKVLDAGAGHGWLAEMLSRRGFEVSALDLGGDSIHRAARRLGELSVPVAFALGDLYSLPFHDSSFDAVVVSEVLEHLQHPPDALAEIARVLRPGGYLVVSCPWRERIEFTRCIHCNRPTPVNAHLHSFDESSMGGLLDGAGFAVERMIRFMSRPAERLGLAGITGFLPRPVWRAADFVFCAAAGRESFMAARAVLHG